MATNKEIVSKNQKLLENSITHSKWDYTDEQWLHDRDEAEKNRIMKRRQKEARQLPEMSYEATQTDNVVKLAINFESPDLSDYKKSEIQKSTLCAATGSVSEDYGRLLMSQTIGALIPSGYDHKMLSNATNHALLALSPQDEYEGMLISRMIVLHNQYMHYMARAANPDTSTEIIDSNINRATKLMRVYNETLETLNKYRRKGEQRVTVQYVNVSGGQAVVAGNFDGGGANDKKSGGSPCQ